MRLPALLALVLTDAVVLATGRPDLAGVAHDLSDPAERVARVGPDRAAATLAGAALWCVAAWVALGLLACLAAALPGSGGRLAGRLARLALPAALYRVAAGAAGLGVLLAPVAAGAALPATATASAPSPGWPSDSPLPAPAWPESPPATPTAAPTRPPASAPMSDRARPRQVVVRPGDSLWAIAADHLPRGVGAQRVAREWPRWYGANRAVIGADPALIRPGQVLHAPASSQEDRP